MTMSPRTKNLAGLPLKLRTNCAEWKNQIDQWTQLKNDGLPVIRQIILLKNNQNREPGQEDQEEKTDDPLELDLKLEQLCRDLQEIVLKMVDIVETMRRLTDQFENVSSLWKLQESCVETGFPFDSWSVEMFWNASREMTGMFQAEVCSKRKVLENVANVSTPLERSYLLTVWRVEPDLKSELQSHLRAMQVETGLV